MGLFIWDVEPSKIFLGDTPISKVFLWDTQIRPSWPDKDYLCFTAEQANSTVKLVKSWSPTSVNIETSTDWRTWSDYTFWTNINLSSVWDKVYFRNKSETPTGFSTATNQYYYFSAVGKVAWSGDVNFLLSKNSTTTLVWDYCFYRLFYLCTKLTSAPSLPATTITKYCYYEMFRDCTNLITVPRLPATSMKNYCYANMLQWCSQLKLSSTETSDYTQAYRLPTTWTWATATSWNNLMFRSTWWTFTSNPTINTTYYVHKDNTIV